MSKEELQRILEKECSKELDALQRAEDKIENNPSVAKYIDIGALHENLNVKIVRTCIELVRRGKSDAEEIAFLLSLHQVEGGFLSDLEAYQEFLLDYDDLVRDN